jgi:hypothetical protein
MIQMHLQKVKSKKNCFCVFKVTDEKNRIRIRYSVVRIRGSGSGTKCLGTGTLEEMLKKTVPNVRAGHPLPRRADGNKTRPVSDALHKGPEEVFKYLGYMIVCKLLNKYYINICFQTDPMSDTLH